MRQKAFVIVLIALIAGLSFGWYRNLQSGPQALAESLSMGAVWPDPRPLSEFALFDHNGDKFGRTRLLGQWTLMFFGYTSCPDICPTTMLTMRSVVAQLQNSGAIAPRVVLVTVDPERDDAQTLARYVTYFDAAFVGLRGGEDGLRTLSMQVGAMYERDAADEQGNYEVGHSASLFLVDPQARMHAVFSPPHKAKDIAKKLTAIRRQYDQG